MPQAVLRRSTIIAYAFAAGIALALVGYTVLLMLVLNLTGTAETSRQLTIPLRVVIMGLLGVAFVLSMRIPRHPAILFFLAFSFLYLGRIGVEWIDGGFHLYLSPVEFLLYFLAFVFFPFLFIAATRFDQKVFDRTLRWMFVASVFFVGLTLFYYGMHVGQVGRLSHAMARDDVYISPLALSYVSTLIISVIVVFLIYNKTTLLQKSLLSGLFLFLLIPFFLGASRGSIVALGVVAFFFGIFQRGLKYRVMLLLASLMVVGVVFYAQEYLGTGVFSRMATIQDGIESGAPEAIRLVMWYEGWKQFLSAPILGSSLQLDSFQFHPHNMFIEVLIATGMIGMLTFLGFLWAVLVSAIRIIRGAPRNAWVVAVFLTGFVANLFSGSISSAVTMAIGAGLIVATVAGMRSGKAGLG